MVSFGRNFNLVVSMISCAAAVATTGICQSIVTSVNGEIGVVLLIGMLKPESTIFRNSARVTGSFGREMVSGEYGREETNSAPVGVMFQDGFGVFTGVYVLHEVE